MRRLALFSYVVLWVAVAVAAGCSDNPGITEPPSVVAATSIELRSDRGDYVGAGRTYSYTQADAIISVHAEGGLLKVEVIGDEQWSGIFRLPGENSRLQTGAYANLQRYSLHDDVGGLDWNGDGRGCASLLGSFAIDTVVNHARDLAPDVQHLEQQCNRAAPALRGSVHWRFDDPTTPPGPATPMPSGLWGPAFTPGSDNYVYLMSDPGDYIGQGGSYTYGLDQFVVLEGGGGVTIEVNGSQWWSGEFQAMIGVPQLRAGYYGDLRRFPFHNPAKGGLDWSGEGRGCNELVGWFAVDYVAYADGFLTALELRFEQRCEGADPSLRGAIRWSQPAPGT
jgi:hypothetical protein